MTRKIIFAFLFSFFAVSVSDATNYVKIIRITDSITIKTHNGEPAVYKNITDIPELRYGMKIIATGGTAEIQIFNTATITLEKNQGVMLLKNPITGEIEIAKLETKSKNLFVKAWLAGYASAVFGTDTRVSFLERYPSIIFAVKRGDAKVRGLEGRIYNLTAGEQYEAKQNLLKD